MRRPALLALALTALAVTGCRERAPHAREAGKEFEYAPAYHALSLDGDTVTLASLRGTPVLLNLWATWCPPCREEMPSLQRVHRDFGPRGLRVVGVSLDNRQARDAILRFIATYGVTFTILHDPHDTATEVFRTFGLPETFLIAADGRLVRRWRGRVNGDSPEFRRAVEKVLAGEH